MRVRLLLNGTDHREREYPRILIVSEDGTTIDEPVSIEEAAGWMPLVKLTHLKLGEVTN